MPYNVRKSGSKWVLVRKTGAKKGTIKSRHTSKQKAMAARALIMGKEHGWTPTGKAAREYTTHVGTKPAFQSPGKPRKFSSAWKGGKKKR